MTTRIFATKGKKNKLDITKVKSFEDSRDPIKKLKLHFTEWKKTFANHISDKGLVSQNINNTCNLILKRNNPV